MKRLIWFAAVMLAAACTASPAPPVPAPLQDRAEAAATLASLQQIDDLPLYEMTYLGDYDPLAGVQPVPPASPFGCSLFVASGDPERPLFARNFDWEPHPALLLHTDPPGRYASVSIVDISYLGVTDVAADRERLLKAPLLPFDGMNERGLAVGLAADETGNLRFDPAKPTVGSVRILRLILDHAATVDEALDVLQRYNIDFHGGPALHYLFADASGRSAVAEFTGGQLRVERSGPPWQALTNFPLIGSDEQARQADRRYRTATQALTRAAGVMDWKAAMAVLRAVAQPHTRWSVTYDLRTGEVHVVTGKRWERVHEFRLG